MTDSNPETGEEESPSALNAGRCPEGHLTYPPHPVCPTCGEARNETVDLSGQTGTVLTWTTATTTPPGVRAPNTLAIVEFDIAGQQVRALGGTTGPVSVGDTVRPVYVEELRDPDEAVRETASQRWDGYRFETVESD